MRAIILAAGSGSRLRPLSDNKPKCLVEVAGKSLLQRQLEVLSFCGVDDIVLVGGYEAAQLEAFGLPVVVNAEFSTTNMVESLFCARDYMDRDTLISYGDIVYAPETLASMMAATADVSVAIDTNFLDYWKARTEDYFDDLETLRIDEDGWICEIGGKPRSLPDIQGQYMGLMKFTTAGLDRLGERFASAHDRGTLRGKPVRMAYMTDILQDLIDSGALLKPVFTDASWVEVDTLEDHGAPVTQQRLREIEMSLLGSTY